MRIFSRPLSYIIIVYAALLARPACGETAGGKHFLWRVTDVPQPFYILGSFHALRGSDYPLGHEIDDAINQCRRFVFEYDIEHGAEGRLNKKLMDAAHYPAGSNLKQKVRPELYTYVQKIAKMRASEYNDVKPWAIAFFMMSHPYYYDVSQYWGVESYVLRKAAFARETAGLESVDEHIHVLSDMTDIEGEVFLLQAIVYADKHAAEMPKEVAAYKRGDTQALAAQTAAEDREAPFITWRMIDHRNAQWIPRIESEMKSGKPTLIVVGARHLCGPHNVIGMLQARGHKLEQL